MVSHDLAGGRTIGSLFDAVIHVDADGRVLAINEVARDLLGYESEEIRGEPLAAILQEGFMAAWMMQGLLEAGFVVAEEQAFVSKSGERKPVICSGFVSRDSAGEPVEIAWIARKRVTVSDLAEQLRAVETALKRERGDRRRLAAELEAARGEQKRQHRDDELGKVEKERNAKDQLWEWAEEELRRVQAAFHRTREKLFRLEGERDDAVKQREWADERRRHAEDELQRVREDLQRLERHVQAVQNERASDLRQGRGSSARLRQQPKRNGDVPANTAPTRNGVPGPVGPERYAAVMQRPSDFPLGEGIDWGGALASVDGDLNLLRAIATAFFEDSTQMLTVLRAAVDDGDQEMVERHACLVKGAVKSLGAHVAAQAAARLEGLASSSDLAEIEEAYIALQLEIEKLQPALMALQGRD